MKYYYSSYWFKNCSRLLFIGHTYQRPFFVNNNQNGPKNMFSSGSLSKNPLLDDLINQIKISGPLTVSDYMKQALTHPKYGLYMKPFDIFGPKGHFVTSPEISQLFGEMIAIWILYNWQQFAQSRKLDIIELGPGRGTLTSDIARSMLQFRKRHDHGCRFHLVEISPHLRTQQRRTLCGHDEHKVINSVECSETMYSQSIRWYDSIDHFISNNDPKEKRFQVYVANEFFDAFPIHKFVRDPSTKEWKEMLIDADNNSEKPKLRWIIAKNPTPMSKFLSTNALFQQEIYQNLDHFEFSPQTLLTLEKIIQNINANDSFGSILMCDYGYDDRIDQPPINRDTFRAYRHHKQCDPLTNPGRADLTADVDFGTIRRSLIANNDRYPCRFYGTITQRTFLTRLGIESRLKALLESTMGDEQVQQDLISSSKKLLDDMGNRFKFMTIFGRNLTNGQINRKQKNDNIDGEDDPVKPVGFY